MTSFDQSFTFSGSLRTNSSDTKKNMDEALVDQKKRLKENLSADARVLSLGEDPTELDACALACLIGEEAFPNAETLNLREAGLNDATLARLLESLEKNNTITDLDLSDNEITHSALFLLMLKLTSGTDILQRLSLADIMLDEKGVGYLSESLENNDALTFLDISSVDLSRKYIFKPLLEGIKKNEGVRTLILEGCKMSADMLEDLVDEVSSNQPSKLEELNLDFNFTACNSFRFVKPLLDNNRFPYLRVLSISYALANNSEKTTALSKNLSRVIHRNTTLEELYLRGNCIKQSHCTHLAALFNNTTPLRIFDIEDNAISKHGLKYFSAKISHSTTIQEFRVDVEPEDQEVAKGFLVEIKKVLERNREAARSKTVSTAPSGTSNIARSKLKRGSGDKLLMCNKSVGVPKTKGRRRFKDRIQKFPKPRNTPQSYNDNFSNDDETFVEQERKPRKFKMKLAKLKVKTPQKLPDQTSTENGSYNDNFDNDFTSVSFQDSSDSGKKDISAKKGKKLRNFARKMKPKQAENVKIEKTSCNNNFDDDFETCIINEEEEATCIINDDDDDDDDTVVYEDDENEDMQSVIFDSKKEAAGDGESENHFGTDVKAKRNKGWGPNGTRLAEDDGRSGLSSRDTEPDQSDWDKVTKDEIGYVEAVEKISLEEQSKGILVLEEATVQTIKDMLSEFDNLLDRDENCGTLRSPRKKTGKRNFTKKLGVLGGLSKRPNPIDFSFAKSAIHKSLVKNNLASNICLLNIFNKMRREIGNGVPTQMGGMLPSKLFACIVGEGGEPHIPNIRLLENFSQSLLLVKVIVWSIFKALTVPDHKIDPSGRYLLEEFGKALLNNDCPEKMEDEDGEVITRVKKHLIGERIFMGAIYELLDILILLKPLVAFTEALYLVVKTDTSQPRMSVYEKVDNRRQKKADKQLQKGMRAVEKAKVTENVRNLLIGMRKNLGSSSVKSNKTSNGQEKAITKQQLFDQIGKHQEKYQKEKTQSSRKKKSGKNNKKKTEFVFINESTLKYRENCPERVISVLEELVNETEGLSKILKVDNFLSYLLAFCKSTEILEHYQKRVGQIKKQLPVWIKKLGTEFSNEMLDHLAPAIPQEIETLFKLPKEEIAKKEEATGLSEFQMRLRNLKKSNAPKKANAPKKKQEARKGEMKPTDNFFNPLLNQVFNMKQMTDQSIDFVREFITKRLKNEDKARGKLIAQIQRLCEQGCQETVAKRMLNAKSKADQEIC